MTTTEGPGPGFFFLYLVVKFCCLYAFVNLHLHPSRLTHQDTLTFNYKVP